MEDRFQLYNDDCINVLSGMGDNSVDSIVTDPPYGMGKVSDICSLLSEWMGGNSGEDFVGKSGIMGNDWDKMVPPPLVWKECLRVLKPGGHMMVFAGTRTQDLMGISIRIAGGVLRDEISYVGTMGWHYSSGFPKGTNISKHMDYMDGMSADLENFASYIKECRESAGMTLKGLDDAMGTSTAAGWWEGRRDKIRLPDSGRYEKLKELLSMDGRFDYLYAEYSGETVDTRAGMGVNVDIMSSGRGAPVYVPTGENAKEWAGWNTALKPSHEPILVFRKEISEKTVSGNIIKWGVGGVNVGECSNVEDGIKRWPSNVVVCGDECEGRYPDRKGKSASEFFNRVDMESDFFMYCGKSSASERHMGMGKPRNVFRQGATLKDVRKIEKKGNYHPTIKPIALCEWLVKMVTPEGGTVLDPFMGSGSTGIAAVRNGFRFIGIEQNREYFDISRQRISFQSKMNTQIPLL